MTLASWPSLETWQHGVLVLDILRDEDEPSWTKAAHLGEVLMPYLPIMMEHPRVVGPCQDTRFFWGLGDKHGEIHASFRVHVGREQEDEGVEVDEDEDAGGDDYDEEEDEWEDGEDVDENEEEEG